MDGWCSGSGCVGWPGGWGVVGGECDGKGENEGLGYGNGFLG